MNLKQFKTHLTKGNAPNARYIRLKNDKFEFELLETKKKHIDMIKGKKVISAGFISVRLKVINVTGRPETTGLDIERNPEDTELLGEIFDRNAGSYG